MVSCEPSPTKPVAETTPEVVTVLTPVLPNCIVLGESTTAPKPIAVELSPNRLTNVPEPIAVLLPIILIPFIPPAEFKLVNPEPSPVKPSPTKPVAETTPEVITLLTIVLPSCIVFCDSIT